MTRTLGLIGPYPTPLFIFHATLALVFLLRNLYLLEGTSERKLDEDFFGRDWMIYKSCKSCAQTQDDVMYLFLV